MIEDRYSPEHQKERRKAPAEQVPEARYAYYRRCQVFRKDGEQCKAPAETGALICHAHAEQLAMAVRRERERRAVLEQAVVEMRRRGKPECEAKDLFMDFKGIQVTLAVMAQALIDGRIDCKTAGRLVVQLQTFSKLLWMVHRKGREGRKGLPLINTDDSDLKGAARREDPRLPQISADERRLSKEKDSTMKDTRSTPLSQAQGRSRQATEHKVAIEKKSAKNWAANPSFTKKCEETRIALTAKVLAFGERHCCAHGPPGWARAA